MDRRQAAAPAAPLLLRLEAGLSGTTLGELRAQIACRAAAPGRLQLFSSGAPLRPPAGVMDERDPQCTLWRCGLRSPVNLLCVCGGDDADTTEIAAAETPAHSRPPQEDIRVAGPSGAINAASEVVDLASGAHTDSEEVMSAARDSPSKHVTAVCHCDGGFFRLCSI